MSPKGLARHFLSTTKQKNDNTVVITTTQMKPPSSRIHLERRCPHRERNDRPIPMRPLMERFKPSALRRNDGLRVLLDDIVNRPPLAGESASYIVMHSSKWLHTGMNLRRSPGPLQSDHVRLLLGRILDDGDRACPRRPRAFCPVRLVPVTEMATMAE